MMSALERMIKAMKPISLYDLKIYTLVYKELSFYAAEFDILDEITDELIGECFVDTADDYGLTLYEKLDSAPRTDLTLEQRREMLIEKMNLNVNDNTLDGIKKFFLSVGLECEITENPHICDLYVLATGREYSELERQYIIEKAREFLPYHLTFTVDFREINWKFLDDLSMTFAYLDAKELTWSDFEKYEGG